MEIASISVATVQKTSPSTLAETVTNILEGLVDALASVVRKIVDLMKQSRGSVNTGHQQQPHSHQQAYGSPNIVDVASTVNAAQKQKQLTQQGIRR